MSTTTMNLQQTNQTLSFPASNRLLPPQSSKQSHPPIYLKLNSSVLELLANTESQPEIKLLLSDRDAALRINDNEFHGTQYKEPGHVEVYLPTQNNNEPKSFRNYGEISNRILIKADKSKKILRDPENVDLAQQPSEYRIVQLLKTRPHSLASLQEETQGSSTAIQSVLANVATRTDKGLYVLRASAAKGGTDLQPQGRLPAEPKLHQDAGASINNQGTEDAKPITKVVRKLDKRETPSQNTKPTSQQASADLAATKRKSNVVADTRKKIKKTDTKADMFELARKFQDAYGEYLELYSLLSKRKTRPPSQVEKLMVMHNQLTQWKKTLWSNSRSKSQVK